MPFKPLVYSCLDDHDTQRKRREFEKILSGQKEKGHHCSTFNDVYTSLTTKEEKKKFIECLQGQPMLHLVDSGWYPCAIYAEPGTRKIRFQKGVYTVSELYLFTQYNDYEQYPKHSSEWRKGDHGFPLKDFRTVTQTQGGMLDSQPLHRPRGSVSKENNGQALVEFLLEIPIEIKSDDTLITIRKRIGESSGDEILRKFDTIIGKMTFYLNNKDPVEIKVESEVISHYQGTTIMESPPTVEKMLFPVTYVSSPIGATLNCFRSRNGPASLYESWVARKRMQSRNFTPTKNAGMHAFTEQEPTSSEYRIFREVWANHPERVLMALAKHSREANHEGPNVTEEQIKIFMETWFKENDDYFKRGILHVMTLEQLNTIILEIDRSYKENPVTTVLKTIIKDSTESIFDHELLVQPQKRLDKRISFNGLKRVRAEITNTWHKMFDQQLRDQSGGQQTEAFSNTLSHFLVPFLCSDSFAKHLIETAECPLAFLTKMISCQMVNEEILAIMIEGKFRWRGGIATIAAGNRDFLADFIEKMSPDKEAVTEEGYVDYWLNTLKDSKDEKIWIKKLLPSWEKEDFQQRCFQRLLKRKDKVELLQKLEAYKQDVNALFEFESDHHDYWLHTLQHSADKKNWTEKLLPSWEIEGFRQECFQALLKRKDKSQLLKKLLTYHVNVYQLFEKPRDFEKAFKVEDKLGKTTQIGHLLFKQENRHLLHPLIVAGGDTTLYQLVAGNLNPGDHIDLDILAECVISTDNKKTHESIKQAMTNFAKKQFTEENRDELLDKCSDQFTNILTDRDSGKSEIIWHNMLKPILFDEQFTSAFLRQESVNIDSVIAFFSMLKEPDKLPIVDLSTYQHLVKIDGLPPETLEKMQLCLQDPSYLKAVMEKSKKPAQMDQGYDIRTELNYTRLINGALLSSDVDEMLFVLKTIAPHNGRLSDKEQDKEQEITQRLIRKTIKSARLLLLPDMTKTIIEKINDDFPEYNTITAEEAECQLLMRTQDAKDVLEMQKWLQNIAQQPGSECQLLVDELNTLNGLNAEQKNKLFQKLQGMTFLYTDKDGTTFDARLNINCIFRNDDNSPDRGPKNEVVAQILYTDKNGRQVETQEGRTPTEEKVTLNQLALPVKLQGGVSPPTETHINLGALITFFKNEPDSASSKVEATMDRLDERISSMSQISSLRTDPSPEKALHEMVKRTQGLLKNISGMCPWTTTVFSTSATNLKQKCDTLNKELAVLTEELEKIDDSQKNAAHLRNQLKRKISEKVNAVIPEIQKALNANQNYLRKDVFTNVTDMIKQEAFTLKKCELEKWIGEITIDAVTRKQPIDVKTFAEPTYLYHAGNPVLPPSKPLIQCLLNIGYLGDILNDLQKEMSANETAMLSVDETAMNDPDNLDTSHSSIDTSGIRSLPPLTESDPDVLELVEQLKQQENVKERMTHSQGLLAANLQILREEFSKLMVTDQGMTDNKRLAYIIKLLKGEGETGLTTSAKKGSHSATRNEIFSYFTQQETTYFKDWKNPEEAEEAINQALNVLFSLPNELTSITSGIPSDVFSGVNNPEVSPRPLRSRKQRGDSHTTFENTQGQKPLPTIYELQGSTDKVLLQLSIDAQQKLQGKMYNMKKSLQRAINDTDDEIKRAQACATKQLQSDQYTSKSDQIMIKTVLAKLTKAQQSSNSHTQPYVNACTTIDRIFSDHVNELTSLSSALRAEEIDKLSQQMLDHCDYLCEKSPITRNALTKLIETVKPSPSCDGEQEDVEQSPLALKRLIVAHQVLSAHDSIEKINHTVEQLIMDNPCIHQLLNLKQPLADLKNAGKLPKDIVEFPFTKEELKDIGYTAKELWDTGKYHKQDLSSAGYLESDLTSLLSNLKEEEYRADVLLSRGFTAKELKTAGYLARHLLSCTSDTENSCPSKTDLTNAGYSEDELIAALQHLKTQQISAKLLNNKGFTITDFKKADFCPNKLHLDLSGSITDLEQQLVKAGYTHLDTSLFTPPGSKDIKSIHHDCTDNYKRIVRRLSRDDYCNFYRCQLSPFSEARAKQIQTKQLKVNIEIADAKREEDSEEDARIEAEVERAPHRYSPVTLMLHKNTLDPWLQALFVREFRTCYLSPDQGVRLTRKDTRPLETISCDGFKPQETKAGVSAIADQFYGKLGPLRSVDSRNRGLPVVASTWFMGGKRSPVLKRQWNQDGMKDFFVVIPDSYDHLFVVPFFSPANKTALKDWAVNDNDPNDLSAKERKHLGEVTDYKDGMKPSEIFAWVNYNEGDDTSIIHFNPQFNPVGKEDMCKEVLWDLLRDENRTIKPPNPSPSSNTSDASTPQVEPTKRGTSTIAARFFSYNELIIPTEEGETAAVALNKQVEGDETCGFNPSDIETLYLDVKTRPLDSAIKGLRPGSPEKKAEAEAEAARAMNAQPAAEEEEEKDQQPAAEEKEKDQQPAAAAAEKQEEEEIKHSKNRMCNIS